MDAHETRSTERRAPLTPSDAARLVADGATVTVEESPQRVFGAEAYAPVAAGSCRRTRGRTPRRTPTSSASRSCPPPLTPCATTTSSSATPTRARRASGDLLRRFADGGGALLDLEYLTEDGRRVIAFGYWAGYVGASLGLLAAAGRLDAPLRPMERAELDALVAAAGSEGLRALVVGALGRSGRGAVDALTRAAAAPTAWDRGQTALLDRDALRAHDLLVNCVLSTVPQPPFVGPEDLGAERALRVVADVTCDVTSEHNLIPVNTAITSWEEPARRLADGPRPRRHRRRQPAVAAPPRGQHGVLGRPRAARPRAGGAAGPVGRGPPRLRGRAGHPLRPGLTPAHEGQRTRTRAPIGMRFSAQIMLMAPLLSRAQPCEAGYGGMLGDPWIAQPR